MARYSRRIGNGVIEYHDSKASLEAAQRQEISGMLQGVPIVILAFAGFAIGFGATMAIFALAIPAHFLDLTWVKMAKLGLAIPIGVGTGFAAVIFSNFIMKILIAAFLIFGSWKLAMDLLGMP